MNILTQNGEDLIREALSIINEDTMKELPRNLTGTASQEEYGDDPIELPTERRYSHADMFYGSTNCEGDFRAIGEWQNGWQSYRCDECGKEVSESELIHLAIEAYGSRWDDKCTHTVEVKDEHWDFY